MVAFNGTDWPFFKIARSKAMPRVESDSPFPFALASVTCPTSLELRGMMTLPSDKTSAAVLAVTSSPGLFFLESNDLLSTAGTCVPLGMATPEVFASADALLEIELEAAAFPDLEPCLPCCDTPVLVDVLVELLDWAFTPDCEAETAVSDW